ncbi:MAG: pentapeptide repeat-containing protein [Prochloraceae cyanobacterium]|nr:pentapeptide repeat-containing protein [Prochloraceae cyanobacterium]
MKLKIITSTAVLGVISLSAPAMAENIQHLSELLSTNQCSHCDLIGSGLVMADLSGADLRGANLTNANLSRANLIGADLSGANLTGASLYGANLSGADLSSTNLAGTDLRDAYLVGANLDNNSLEKAYMQGAIGIPEEAATEKLFYSWGMNEASTQNFLGAIEYFDRAIALDPEYARAYLARAVALYRLGNEAGSIKDAEIAAKIFENRENKAGYEASKDFINNIKLASQPVEEKPESNGNIGRLFLSVTSLALQFLLPY